MSLDPVSSIADLATAVVSRIWPDKTEVDKEKFAKAIQEELDQTQLLTKQMDVDAAEAGNPNRTWISWRELVGYICATAMGWTYLIQPMFTYFVVISGHPTPVLPQLDVASLMYLLTGMLGIASIKTYEKVNLKDSSK